MANITANTTTTTTAVPTLNELGLCGMLGTKFGYKERDVWFQLFWAFGIVFIASFSASWFFLWKFLDFRLDRVDALLASKGWVCTRSRGPDETEVSRGRRIFWASKLVQFLLVFPIDTIFPIGLFFICSYIE